MHDEQPTLEQLKHGRAIAATIVKLHGEKYLPFFKRLHEDVQKAEAAKRDIDQALQFANLALLERG